MRELLIVGIDPGTTAGYAVLDMKGNVMRTRSSKLLELNSLIEEIAGIGTILAMGTDKKKCPALIQKAAAKTGARIITPGEDLTQEEKRALLQGKGFHARDDHERDALAAARYAYRELEPLLLRIGKTLEKEGKQALLREVTETVVMTGVNIKAAVMEIESAAARELQESQESSIPQAAQIRESTNYDLQRLQLKRVERENEILRSYNDKLLARLKQLNNENRKLNIREKKIESRKPEERQAHMAELVAKLRQIIQSKELQISKLNQEQRLLSAVTASGQQIVKKLKTLGMEELEKKNKVLQLSDNDVIIVETPEIFSDKALKLLQQKNVTVLTRKKPTTTIAKIAGDAGVTLISIEGFQLLESENFAAADRKKLTDLRQKSAKTNVTQLIESYKEERKIERDIL